VKAIRLCTRICTELLKDDSDGERLAERVDDIMNDNPRSKVRWIQTAVSEDAAVRLTGIITWEKEINGTDASQG
jgi:hypothetical protein